MYAYRSCLRSGVVLRLILACISISLAVRAHAQSNQESLLPSPLANETPSLRFEHLTLEDGLVQGSANSIMQDRQGFLWIATQGGLHRFDGHEFKVYAATPFDTTALSDGYVMSATEATNGDIWVTTMGGGLNRMNPASGTFTHYRHDPDDSTSLSSDYPYHALESSNGDLWVSTVARGGLNRMRAGEDGRFTHFRHDNADTTTLSSNSPRHITEDAEGYIWVGSDNGINRIDPDTEEITRFLYETDLAFSVESPTYVYAQYHSVDEQGILWLATGNGLVRLDSETGTHERFLLEADEGRGDPLNLLHQVVPDPAADGVLWVVGPSTGLARFDTRAETFTTYRHDPRDPHSLAENHALSILPDRSGTMWVGYASEGVSTFNPGALNFAHLRHDPEDAESLAPGLVWGIHEDRGGTLWVGTQSGTAVHYLTKIDAATGTVTRFQHDPNDAGTLQQGSISRIVEDEAGQIWVAGTGGLSRIDRTTGRITRFLRETGTVEGRRRNTTYTLQPSVSEPDVLWIGNTSGIDLFDTRTGRFTPVPVSQQIDEGISPVISLLENSEGILWAGSAGMGLIRVDPSTQEDTRAFVYDPRDTTSIGNNFVHDIAERADEPGVLWLALGGGGLNRFDTRKGTATHFTEEDGLANNIVYGILVDESGTLWMSTNGGISNFDPEKETFRNYGLDDGLMALEYNQNAFAKGAGGVVYFGSSKGVTVFAPERLHTNQIPPPVALTDFKLFNKSVAVGPDSPLTQRLSETELITLDHDQNEVTFDFIGLHFANAKKNRYAYRLEGYDRDWVEAGTNRSATYTNLPPGRYRFHVRAANSDGVWNEQGASVGLRITPPWWRTWWAYMLFGLLFAGAVFATDRVQRWRLMKKERIRTKQLEERGRELEGLVEVRTVEIQQRVEELAVINSVQEGLVRELDIEAIYNLVGDRIRDLFDAQVVAIATFDPAADLVHVRYSFEKGRKHTHAPQPIDVVRRRLIETREPILINEDFIETLVEYGIERPAPMPGTEMPKSVLFVPMVVGDTARGYVSLQNIDREHAFTHSDVSLLTTLANSMSVALENARLFAETSRLLVETRQQAGELDTVNRVSRALVAQLEFDALVHLVGEQMRETFEADIVYVALHDREHDVIRFPYAYGEDLPPLPMGKGMVSQIITSREPLLINRDIDEVRAQFKMEKIGREAASYLGVPILAGEEAIGVISVQSTAEEGRFDADDLRLLGTIAANVGVALQNADAYRELNTTLDHLKQTQQQLVQSEKMASLGALTAGIAHEIKNPLNFVNNFASLSEQLVDELNEECETNPEIRVRDVEDILQDLKTNAAKIRKHGQRADSIVRSMMQHARGGTGQREQVDLNTFVDEYVDLAWHGRRATAPDFNIDLVRDYGKGVGRVEVVPQDLGRVLINLLSNAFDAVMDRTTRVNGQYEPQVRVVTRSVRQGSVEIRVEDNGSGIPPEVKAKIFEPFFTTKPTGSGTGLGLSMSYDIITQGHGGTLEVESEEGHGASFVMRMSTAQPTAHLEVDE